MNVYACLYDEVKNRTEDEKVNNEALRQAFLMTVGTEPAKIDYSVFKDLHGEELFEGLYLAAFQTIPDDNELRGCPNMSDEEIVSAIINKPTFIIRKLSLYNCEYKLKQSGLKKIVFTMAQAVTGSIALRKLAKKMPSGIQKKIRGAFH